MWPMVWKLSSRSADLDQSSCGLHAHITIVGCAGCFLSLQHSVDDSSVSNRSMPMSRPFTPLVKASARLSKAHHSSSVKAFRTNPYQHLRLLSSLGRRIIMLRYDARGNAHKVLLKHTLWQDR